MASAPSDARAAAETSGGYGTATVSDAMLHHPMVSPASLTAAQAHGLFADDHLHALLVIDGDVLLAVVERSDLFAADRPDAAAHRLGRLEGRTVHPDADLELMRLELIRLHRRRLAVVRHDARLLGLLCLNRTGLRFCSDADVQSRAAEHRARPSGRVPPVGLEPTLRPF